MKIEPITFEQQTAIEEKIEQLKKIKDCSMSPKELADIITERRVSWMLGHTELLEKYETLTPVRKAHNIIFLDYMGRNPDYSKAKRIQPLALRINSHNFCPYLIACEKLDLDTRFVCKEILEPSVREMCRMIHPKLTFMRDYEKGLRPYHPEFCREYIISRF